MGALVIFIALMLVTVLTVAVVLDTLGGLSGASATGSTATSATADPAPAPSINIGADAVLALVIGIAGILAVRSNAFWEALRQWRAAVGDRVHALRNDDEPTTPIDAIHDQYVGREIDVATMESELEEAMEADPSLAGVPGNWEPADD